MLSAIQESKKNVSISQLLLLLQVGREVDIRQIVEGLSSDIVVPSPEMVAAVKCVREHGLKTALLTNNYFLDESKTKTILPVDTSLFDVVCTNFCKYGTIFTILGWFSVYLTLGLYLASCVHL